jgi:hypothetical protein
VNFYLTCGQSKHSPLKLSSQLVSCVFLISLKAHSHWNRSPVAFPAQASVSTIYHFSVSIHRIKHAVTCQLHLLKAVALHSQSVKTAVTNSKGSNFEFYGSAGMWGHAPFSKKAKRLVAKRTEFLVAVADYLLCSFEICRYCFPFSSLHIIYVAFPRWSTGPIQSEANSLSV